MHSSLLHPRQEIVETLLRIYQYRMTTTSGGNLSIRDESGDTWITPTRVDKGSLREEDIVRMRTGGEIDGLHPPSSEYPFHMQIFALRPDIKAIVHAHPVSLVAHAVARKMPDLSLLPMAMDICGQVGFAPYAMPGSQELGQSIAQVFAKGAHCVLMENHGVVIGGASLQDAFRRFETLETCAAIGIRVGQLGGPHALTSQQAALARTPRPTMGEAVFEPTTLDKGVRSELCKFIRRGYCQRLFTSTQGSFSARVDDDSFIVNGHAMDRKTACPEGMAIVRGGRCEALKTPSRTVALHQAIYRRHRDVRAIIMASPVCATAFAASGVKLDPRTLPESYLFLKDLPTVPFEHFAADPAALANEVSLAHPAALLQNEGALVLGKSVLDAFDRLEVLEATAEAFLLGRQLGAIHAISNENIDALVKAFNL